MGRKSKFSDAQILGFIKEIEDQDQRRGRGLDRMIGPANAQRGRITLAAERQTAQSRMREAGPIILSRVRAPHQPRSTERSFPLGGSNPRTHSTVTRTTFE
jgi:hypothetical protein